MAKGEMEHMDIIGKSNDADGCNQGCSVDSDIAHMKAAARAAAFARRDALSADIRLAKSASICAEAMREIEAHCLEMQPVEGQSAETHRTETRCVKTQSIEMQSAEVQPAETYRAKKHGECGSLSASAGLQKPQAIKRPLIAAYYEIKTEVTVEPLRTAAWERGWRVALPCVITPGHIEFFEVTRAVVEAGDIPFVAHPARAVSAGDIQAFLAAHGLGEEDCRMVSPKDIDAIIVPLVAFNPEGGRLGYGGGNYDRYIPRMRADALPLGVAFAEQRDDALQLEKHDCHMAKVISA